MKLIGVCSVVFLWFLIPAAIIGYFYRLLAIGYLSTVGQGDWDRDLESSSVRCQGSWCSGWRAARRYHHRSCVLSGALVFG